MSFYVKHKNGTTFGTGDIEFSETHICFLQEEIPFEDLIAISFQNQMGIFEVGTGYVIYVTRPKDVMTVQDGMLINLERLFDYRIPLTSIVRIKDVSRLSTSDAVYVFSSFSNSDEFYYIKVEDPEVRFSAYSDYDVALLAAQDPDDIITYRREFLPNRIKIY